MKEQTIFSAFLYSKNKNLEISYKVKEVLDKNKYNLFYLNDIDDVLLSRYSNIDILILDFTIEILDFKSIELLKKLKERNHIGNIIIVVKSSLEKLKGLGEEILYDDDFNINLSKITTDIKKNNISLGVINSSCVKIISDYLTEVGISSKLSGFYLLIDSLSYYLANNEKVGNLSANLYPYLANKYCISVPCVEMRLRNSIYRAKFNSDKTKNINNCSTIKGFITHSLSQVYGLIFPSAVINY